MKALFQECFELSIQYVDIFFAFTSTKVYYKLHGKYILIQISIFIFSVRGESLSICNIHNYYILSLTFCIHSFLHTYVPL